MLNQNHIIESEPDYAGFIPELWSQEILESYKKNLVMANLTGRSMGKSQLQGRSIDYVIFDEFTD